MIGDLEPLRLQTHLPSAQQMQTEMRLETLAKLCRQDLGRSGMSCFCMKFPGWK